MKLVILKVYILDTVIICQHISSLFCNIIVFHVIVIVFPLLLDNKNLRVFHRCFVSKYIIRFSIWANHYRNIHFYDSSFFLGNLILIFIVPFLKYYLRLRYDQELLRLLQTIALYWLYWLHLICRLNLFPIPHNRHFIICNKEKQDRLCIQKKLMESSWIQQSYTIIRALQQ